MEDSSEEVWKVIPGTAEKYAVSTLGRVKRLKNGNGTHADRMLGGVWTLRRRYLQVLLCIGPGKRRRQLVHRLVAEAFLKAPRSDGMQVNHRDANKANNAVSNLEWVTPKQNAQHAWRHGLYIRPWLPGELAPSARLTEVQVRDIRRLAVSQTQGSIASLFGVHQSTISRIVNNKRWRQSPCAPAA